VRLWPKKVSGRNDVLVFCRLQVGLCIRLKHGNSICDRLSKMLEEHFNVRVRVEGTRSNRDMRVSVVS